MIGFFFEYAFEIKRTVLVTVDRTRTNAEALRATGIGRYNLSDREIGFDDELVSAMPTAEWEEKEVFFFEEDFGNDGVRLEKVLRHLEHHRLVLVDPIALAAAVEQDRSLAIGDGSTETYWESSPGIYSSLSFSHSLLMFPVRGFRREVNLGKGHNPTEQWLYGRTSFAGVKT